VRRQENDSGSAKQTTVERRQLRDTRRAGGPEAKGVPFPIPRRSPRTPARWGTRWPVPVREPACPAATAEGTDAERRKDSSR
jgi:hypothetical protein